MPQALSHVEPGRPIRQGAAVIPAPPSCAHDPDHGLSRRAITLAIPREVLSHNLLYHAHWSAVSKDRRAWESFVHVVALHAKAERSELPRRCTVRILAVRKRLIRDTANLVGGCKGLVDALVSQRLIYDDADRWCTITYAQELCHGQPPSTIVSIEEAAP